MIKLTQKVDQLRFEYLEKDRELQVLKNEIQLKEASFASQIEILQASQNELRHSNNLLKTELAAATQSQGNSDSAMKIEVPQDILQREHIQKIEGECEQLRERVRLMTVAEEKLKVLLQQTEFAKIKAEEEAKKLRDDAVQRSIKIRYLEDISEENSRLQAHVSSQQQEFEAFKIKASQELEEARAIKPQAEEISSVKQEELQAALVSLKSQIELISCQNQELKAEINKDDISQNTSNEQFKMLYLSLLRARTLILLIAEILHLGIPAQQQEDQEAIQGSVIGKRQRLE